MHLPNIHIVGSGRVAEALLGLFTQKGSWKIFISGRNEDKIALLTNKYPIQRWDPALPAMPILLCVPDSSIADVAKTYLKDATFFIHFSGSTPIDSLPMLSGGRAVCWPVQSFGSLNSLVWNEISLFTEAEGEPAMLLLQEITALMGGPVHQLNSAQRQKMHLTAVYLNNFVNHLAAIAHDYCKENDLPFEALFPMLQTTVNMIHHPGPRVAQTGPARRNDAITLQRHLQLLNDHPQMREIYQLFSTQIIQRYL